MCHQRLSPASVRTRHRKGHRTYLPTTHGSSPSSTGHTVTSGSRGRVNAGTASATAMPTTRRARECMRVRRRFKKFSRHECARGTERATNVSRRRVRLTGCMATDGWQVEGLDLDGYLRRVGVNVQAPSAAALAELHEAHVRAFTFDNVD